MVLKTFEIDYKGKKEIVEYESDVEYGIIAPILRNNVDASNPMQSKVNIPDYQMAVLQKVITKAPFDFHIIKKIYELPGRTVVTLIDHVMDDYAMGIFLEGWMKTLLGSENLTQFISESMPSAPQPSDGIKSKPTNSPSTGSKTSQI